MIRKFSGVRVSISIAAVLAMAVNSVSVFADTEPNPAGSLDGTAGSNGTISQPTGGAGQTVTTSANANATSDNPDNYAFATGGKGGNGGSAFIIPNSGGLGG